MVGFINAFFYPVRRIYIWSTLFKFFMTFIIQQMNTIKYKITTSNWCFQSNLIPRKSWLKTFFYNFICFVINYYFYIITFWSITCSSTLSWEVLKLIAINNWIFHISDFLRFWEYGLIWWRHTSADTFLSLLHSYSILIITPKIASSQWFMIIFIFFMLKRVSNISNCSIFNCFIFL